MSEFMEVVLDVFDAKPEGFLPGGMSLHCKLHYGLDAEAHERTSSIPLKPSKLTNTLAFMFETRFPHSITAYAAELLTRDHDYRFVGIHLSGTFLRHTRRIGVPHDISSDA